MKNVVLLSSRSHGKDTTTALIHTPIFFLHTLQRGAQPSGGQQGSENPLSRSKGLRPWSLQLPYKDIRTCSQNPKVEKANGWHLAALFWSLTESRHWSPDRSCQWYNVLCLYGLFYNGVETGEGTSCRLAWCPLPAALDGPRQATGARVSSWGL